MLRVYFRLGPRAGKATIWRYLAAHMWWAERVQIAKTNFGATMVVNAADIVGRYITYFGIWEPSMTAWLRATLKPGDTFVDVGANVGYFTLLASNLVGPTGRIVSVEPSAATRCILERNVSANRLSNVRIVEAAVSDRSGSLPIFSDGVTGTATLDPGWAAKQHLERIGDVPVLPLPDLLTREERESLSVIKIDVEGLELAVLRGSQRLLRDHRPIVMSELMIDDLEAALDLMTDLGYTASEIPNDYRASSYIAGRIEEPRPLPASTADREQIDVLFHPVGASSGR